MKRVALHIIFWVLYALQDTVMLFTWYRPTLHNYSNPELFGVSAIACLVYISLKLVIIYYLMYSVIRRLLAGTSSVSRIIVEVSIALLLTVIAYRAMAYYIIRPIVYHGDLKQTPFFEVTSLLIALMDLGAIIGSACTIKVVRILLAAKDKEKNLVKEKLGTELKFLKNQTNPHFLMNTLNNIYALARKKSEETSEVVMKLSELLRFMLYESSEKRIKLSDEVKVLDDYLELETMRYNQRLAISFSKDIDNCNYQITPLLLLPFVENAFKHGISETRFESYIKMNLVVKEDVLNFSIKNNKEPRTYTNGSNNIGLTNVKRQLELMYADHDLTVLNEPESFTVNLTIKLNSYVEI